MVPAFIGFGAAFILGSLRVVIGGAGLEIAGCPAIIDGFPAGEAACNWFSGFVVLGGLLAIIGGGGASWMLALGKLSA